MLNRNRSFFSRRDEQRRDSRRQEREIARREEQERIRNEMEVQRREQELLNRHDEIRIKNEVQNGYTFDYVYNTIYNDDERRQINEQERERMREIFDGSFRSLILDKERRIREEQECIREEVIKRDKRINVQTMKTEKLKEILNNNISVLYKKILGNDETDFSYLRYYNSIIEKLNLKN